MLDAYLRDLEAKHHGEVVVLKNKIQKVQLFLVVALFCFAISFFWK